MSQVFACQIDETMMGEEAAMDLSTLSRKKPKKKNIEYGPAPKHLIAAVRKELRRLIELPDLDANLGLIGRFANQADDMLMCVKAPVAVMRGEHEVTVPGVADAPGNVETYGATFLRTILAQISASQSATLQSPEALVGAIAAARRDGMPDVAAELEKKLVGKKLDGKRPINEGALYLPALSEAAPIEAAPKRRKNGKKAAAALNGGALADAASSDPQHATNGAAT